MAGRPRKYLNKEESRKVIIENAIRWRKDNRERVNELARKRREKDPKKFSIAQKKWRDENKDNHVKYYKENKERIREKSNERNKIRKRTDPRFKFICTIRRLVCNSFKRNGKTYKKNTKTENILGCSKEFFIDYILSKCPNGVTLKDFGIRGYHIDHIIPISTGNTQEEIVKLCHYTNLQPLFWIENLKKSNKLLYV